MLVFEERGKPEDPEKNPQSKDENQQQTEPSYDAESGNRTRATLVGPCSLADQALHWSSPKHYFNLTVLTINLTKVERVIISTFLRIIKHSKMGFTTNLN